MDRKVERGAGGELRYIKIRAPEKAKAVSLFFLLIRVATTYKNEDKQTLIKENTFVLLTYITQ